MSASEISQVENLAMMFMRDEGDMVGNLRIVSPRDCV